MGIIESVKGKLKGTVGEVTHNDALKAEGKAQAAKGAEASKAAQARVEATAHDVKSKLQETKQDIAEKAK